MATMLEHALDLETGFGGALVGLPRETAGANMGLPNKVAMGCRSATKGLTMRSHGYFESSIAGCSDLPRGVYGCRQCADGMYQGNYQVF